ncbi:putative dynactin 22 kDa subunit [Tieghemostelium lacteum]|uniref:Putative dynactin 22 kDa subunit n=1 Tax=Tieghemostelium lacteum TaxID=361077 RepID=A0A152A0X8_TIELA|nr:putative dynactin 22 kDa subunit [Tieghemostelium lacteum]|eukprot:KYQ99912.1 putative dynactin 22 kDa subunit [Tieghemostelium lacteum]
MSETAQEQYKITNEMIDEIESRLNKLEFMISGSLSTSDDNLMKFPLLQQQTIQSLQQQQKKATLKQFIQQTIPQKQPLPQPQQQSQILQITENIVETINRYQTKLNTIKSENESISAYLTLYNQCEKRFNQILDDQPTLNSVEKLAIILSAEDELLQTAKNLQKLNELEKFINTESLSSLPQLTLKLKPIENLHAEQEAITIQLNKKLGEKVQSYNDIIKELSFRFQYWDKVLTELERSV